MISRDASAIGWSSLVQILEEHAGSQDGRLAFTFLEDGEDAVSHLSYGQLSLETRALAAELQARGLTGERVLLLYPPGLDFAIAFLACLYAGAVAVPAYPPHRQRTQGRWTAIVEDAEPRSVMTSAEVLPRLDTERLSLAGAEVLITRAFRPAPVLGSLAASWREPELSASSLAFLQYTSGSTSLPKGVMVTHGNLVHNERLIEQAFAQSERSVVVSWLPLYHDMGLIGGLLQPLFLGARCVLMSPVAFLQKPLRWLAAISKHRATTSGGPNFAYELCLRRLGGEDRAALDLSSWTVAFNGAEPVRADTLERFSATLREAGFRPEACYPCYGLAEATLFVRGGQLGSRPRVGTFDTAALGAHRVVPARRGSRLVSAGEVGQEVRIVEPQERREVAPGAVGEIWVRSESVAAGYWRRPEATAETFRGTLAGRPGESFLRTGDLGFLLGGELFVAGRLKDLIIVRGRNLYPQDVELAAERSHAALRPGGLGAFAVDVAGEERLVVVAEAERWAARQVEVVAEAVRRAVAEEHEISVYEVLLLLPGGLPKTSSGKVQRHRCRQLYLEGGFSALGHSVLEAAETEAEGLVGTLSRLLGVASSSIRPESSLTGLGLDSLAAIELKHRLESELGAELPLTDLLSGITVSELEARLAAAVEGPGPAVSTAVEEPDLEEALSPGQEALWFLHRLEPESSAYHIAAAVRVVSGLDLARLEGALRALLRRHGELRARFPEVEGRPRRRVEPDPPLALSLHGADGLGLGELQERVAAAAAIPFDLEQGPLLRVDVWRRDEGEVVLLLVVHHVVADFWSMAVLARELGALYQGAGLGPPPSRGRVIGQLRRELAGESGERHWEYWRDQLEGAATDLDLPTDFPFSRERRDRGASFRLDLGPQRLEALEAVARRGRATPFSALLAAFEALLARWSGQGDFLVGAPMAGRLRAESADLIGYHVNTVPLRARVTRAGTFAQLMAAAQEAARGALEHQEYPLSWLTERLQPPRQPGRTPLFQVLFNLPSLPPREAQSLTALALGIEGVAVGLGELTVEAFDFEQRASRFDLALTAARAEGRLRAVLAYDRGLFEPTTIERLGRCFERLLDGVLEHPERPLGELELLSQAERAQLVGELGAGEVVASSEATLPALFFAQAARSPEAPAVWRRGQATSYRALAGQAARVRDLLLARGLGTEQAVAVCLGRRPELVAVALGTMAAGGTYLPLDPKQPAARLAGLVADARPALVVAETATLPLVAGVEAAVVAVESLLAEAAEVEAARAAAEIEVLSGQAAYLIFTSGSTGRPKGVVVEHRAILNRLAWGQRAYPLEAADRVALIASIGFDFAIWELFAPLLVGASVVLPEAEDVLGQAEELASTGSTVAHFVPSVLQLLADTGRLGTLGTVRLLFAGGEALPRDLAERVLAESGAQLWNQYGPTEATVDATALRCEAPAVARGPAVVPIGRAIDNLRTLVCGQDGRLQPLGVPGELLLGGVGLARGYLGRPGQTAERFVPDSLSGEAGARLYRTGDRVRLHPSGVLEFLGRLDEQVKLRGVRIELGEVEEALRSVPGVREGVVALAGEGSGARLVAYWVGEAGSEELAAELGRQLPEAMVPSRYLRLEALPRTPSGKVDRRALPAPEWAEEEAGEAPRTPLEARVAAVMGEVLGVSGLGRTASFFALGGHSLLATRLVSRLREELGIELPLRAVFEAPTVAGMAKRMECAEIARLPKIEFVDRSGALPLSFAQERLWFLEQLEPGTAAYHLPARLGLTGELSVPALRRAFEALVARHEVLRTAYRAVGEQVVQRVLAAPRGWPLALVDLSGLAEGAGEARRLSGREARLPFDLAAGRVLRTCLLRRGPREHELLATVHHIAADGWSTGIFLGELASLYAGRPLAPLPIQYGDFALWQRRWLAGEALAAQLAYWREALAGAPELLELPADRPRGGQEAGAAGTVAVELGPALAEGLRSVARAHGATPFMVLLSAFGALLARLGGERDLVIGSPIANRRQAETEGLIGFFVNTLALRLRLGGDPSLESLLAQVRETTLAAYAHQDLPFERLVEELGPERRLGVSPLFQVMLALQQGAAEGLELDGVAGRLLREAPARAKFELTLEVEEVEEVEGHGFRGRLEYAAERFDATSAERLARRFERLLGAALLAPAQPLGSLSLLDLREQAELAAWSDTGALPPEGTLDERFARQAARTPEREALVCGEVRLSYRRLDAWSNRVAWRLRAEGVGPEVRVGVRMERTVELVVALLGILKAGGAYVPLDPTYPAERLAYMLADSGALRVLESIEPEPPSWEPPPAPAVAPGGLAYLIYTSGSTGRPKGVAIEHRSAVARVDWSEGVFPAEVLGGVLASTSVCFDLSVFELFVPLLRGGRVILAANALALAQAPWGDEVTLLNTVPSAANELVRLGAIPPSVRWVCLAGEPLRRGLADRLYGLGTVDSLLNLYGPSEDTTYSTWVQVPASEAGEPTLGRPLAGTTAWVIDALGGRAPVGTPGELLLGGRGQARGYLGRPGLSAERFVPDALSGAAGARLYRTGDRVRRRGDGELELLGRLDFQVKVRGFRIELGEVEAALLRLPGAREAVAVVREEGEDRRLVGYVAVVPAAPSPEAARAALAAWLPEAIVPSAVVVLEALPRTPNGKVDRKALPAPDWAGAAEGEAPRTALEVRLAGVFGELLGVPAVSRDASFFALGGHSLLATRLVSRLREALGVELPLRAVFEVPTVAGLAGRLASGESARLPKIECIDRGGDLPLSFAQERLWFLEQLEPDAAAYHLPARLALAGKLSVAALARALAGLVARHEVLRTAYVAEGERGLQRVLPAPARRPLPVVDLSAVAEAATEASRLSRAEARLPFDLGRGRVLRTSLLRRGAAEHELLATAHHIAGDGWSTAVFLRELGSLYASPAALAPLPIQFGDYAAWQRRWLTDAALEAELAHWRQELAGAPEVLELPADRPRADHEARTAGMVEVVLGPLSTERLRALARAQGATPFMVLLAAFGALLARWSGERELVIGSPIANRRQAETEGLIGCFVNTLALRLRLAGDPSFAGLLGRVRETTLAAYAHQDLPFEKLVEELAPERRLGVSPLFQVMLAVQQGIPDRLSLGEVEGRLVGEPPAVAKFELTLELGEGEDGTFAGGLEYAAERFDATTAERLVARFHRLLAAALVSPERPIGTLSLLSPAERAELARDGQGTPAVEPPGLVPAWVSAQALATPDAVAIESPGEAISYDRLEARASQLGRRLAGLGLGAEAPVAVLLPPGPELVVALLGIWKAGGAYLPLPLDQPAARLAGMLDDAGVRFGIGVSAPRLADGAPGLADGDAGLTWLSLADQAAWAEASSPWARPISGDHLAYVLFTSGSTGRPKGTLLAHAGLAQYVAWVAALSAGGPLRSLLLTAPTFDPSLAEMLPALVTGGRLVVAEEGEDRSSRALVERMARHRVTHLELVPSLLAVILEEPAFARLETLRFVFCGGEPLGGELARRFPATGQARLLNAYGPTEATIDAAFHAVEGRSGGAPPIGRARPGSRLLVLDAWWQPAPVGVPGELWIGGEGLARGYLGHPGLTAERFVPDAFSGAAGARLYRSGDRVRRRGDGELELLGRLDFQVKLRGIRIEPGEVEAALLALPGVREAVVVVREQGGDRRLVAYLAGDPASSSPEAARAALAARLPEAMVPSVVVVLGALPRTANGKLDRKALPAPDWTGEADGEPPRTPLEARLAALFGELLGLATVSRDRSFFALGGHSLLATRLVSRLREGLGVEVPLRALFEAPTVAGLAERVAAAGEASLPRVEPVPRGGELPLSFAQERLWFLERLSPGSAALVIFGAVACEGRLVGAALRAAVTAVVDRHEGLRSRFVEHRGEPRVILAPSAPVALPWIDLGGLDAAAAELEAGRLQEREPQRPFDLERGPLARFRLLRLAPERHVLLVSLHHVVADGWSLSILVRELAHFYGEALGEQLAPLPLLPVQVADFAAWQRRVLSPERLEAEVVYWRRTLSGAPRLELPTDRPRPRRQSSHGARLVTWLPGPVVASLERFTREREATPFMALLAVLAGLLGRWSGQQDVTLGTPVAGRLQAESEGLIGCFLNTLAIRTDLSGSPGLGELVRRTRLSSLAAFSHQQMPFERLLEALRPERDPSRTPLFQVMLNVLNLPPAPLELAGLRLEELPPARVEAKLDLTLYVEAEAERLRLAWVYNTDLFERARIAELARQFEVLLSAALGEPARPLRSFSLVAGLPPGLLPDPTVPLARLGADPWVGAVPELLARQAARHPGREAVRDHEESWTYGELEAQAGRLAAALIAGGVRRGEVVAVYAQRSASLPWVLAGVLRAGAAFVILDPAYPPARLLAIVAAARPAALVSLAAAGTLPAALEEGLAARPGLLRLVAPRKAERPAAETLVPLPESPALGPEELAYLAFTSGSTGRPKGIAGLHGSLTQFLPWRARELDLRPDDRFALLAGLAHDPLHRDLFTPLYLGATLLVPEPRRLAEPGYLAAWLAREGVTVLHLTPALARLIAEASPAGSLPRLRRVLFVGEALRAGDVLALRRLAPRAQVVNLYGATETQQALSHYPVPDQALDSPEVLPLGRGSAGVQLLVVNDEGVLAAPGEVGELWFRSAFLARGYVGEGAEATTAERFPANPFTGSAGDRVYRTGDLGRFDLDGNVRFAGRADDQVQIRGFRVEPAEIAGQLESHPGVTRAHVLAHPGAEDEAREPVLVAYWVPRDGVATDGDQLRAHLRRQLPEYMVPAVLVEIPHLPLTPNGKVDARALPPPQRPGRAGRPPAGELERAVAAIFHELLGVEVEDAEASFFDLGGHSLLATRLLARLRDDLGVPIELADLFERSSVAALARRLEAGGTGAEPWPPIVPMPREGRLPLSFSQERQWFLDQLEPGNPAYNIVVALEVEGALAVAALAAALDAVLARHEVLRTAFRAAEGRPFQEVLAPGPLRPVVVDLSGLVDGAPAVEARRLAGVAARVAFDLRTPPLLAAWLHRLAPGRHLLVLSVHHIAFDGWSQSLLVRDLCAAYTAILAGERRPLPAPTLHYADYAAWQRGWLAEHVLAGQLGYWRERWRQPPEPLELATDRPRPAVAGAAARRATLVLAPAETAALRALAARWGGTLFMAQLGLLAGLLGRLSGQREIGLGTYVANRRRRELEELIGFFVNTLALRIDLRAGGFGALLEGVRAETLAAFAHQDVPFEQVLEAVQPERSLDRTPLFQALCVLQNMPIGELRLPGLELRPVPLERRSTAFEVALWGEEREGELHLALDLRADLFDASTAERLARGYRQLARQAVAEPERPLHSLALLEEGERQQLLHELAGGGPVPAGAGRLEARVLACAARQPEAVAVAQEDEHLSYGELAHRSAAVAARLRALGMATESGVGLLVERSPELIVGLLGILGAGGWYLPLDPDSPPERLAFQLEDAGVAALLARASLAGRPAHLTVPVLFLEDAGSAPPSPPAATAGEGALAYVIYTSGSTGRPKGVMVEHRSASAYVSSVAARLELGPGARVLQFASASFDASVEEIFPTLTRGGTLVLRTDWMLASVADFLREVEARQLTVLDLPTSYWHEVVARAASFPASVRWLILGGEKARREDYRRFRALAPPALSVLNTYGPTEATVVATWSRLPVCWEAPGELPIGRPVPGARAYVLDRGGEPLPLGSAGELCLAGAGLARGYLGRPALTAERFRPDPFAPLPGERRYHTGDRARWNGRGELEFLGRLDRQVKVRGFRIELEEVERALAALPGVSQAAVRVRETTPDALLEAYVAGEGVPNAAELREALLRSLPAYMVPRAFVLLPELPLGPGGKVDRTRLPQAAPPVVEESAHRPPRTRLERQLAELWSRLLGVSRVGLDDDFFLLGGHSLLATQALSRLRSELGVELPLRAIFEAPTLESLARRVEAAAAVEPRALAIPRRPPAGAAGEAERWPVSFAQQRLWFLDQWQPGTAAYNVPLAVRLRGPLDVAALRAALAALVERHETLRTRFVAGTLESLQVIEARAPVALPVIDLGALPPAAAERLAERLEAWLAAAPFDLERLPLLRLRLIRLGREHHRLLLVQHHIVSDAWSVGVLFADLSRLYAAQAAGVSAALPPLPIQYADFALWQRDFLAGPELERQLGYWHRRLARPAVLELPTDRPRPLAPSGRGRLAEMALPAALLGGLRGLARQAGSSLFVALLAGFYALLWRLSGQRDLLVGTPVAGRDRQETEGLIGFFVNTLVLRCDLGAGLGFGQLVERAHQTALEAFAHGDLPFEKLVEELRPERHLGVSPFFQVVFQMWNTPLEGVALPGLELEGLPVHSSTAKFDLTVTAIEREAGARLLVEYATDLFDATTIERLLRHFLRLLEGALADPAAGLERLPLLAPAERHQLCREWTGGLSRYPRRLCLHQRFLERAAEGPERIALGCEGEHWSYGALERASRGLAARLQGLGVEPESRVGLYLERSPEVVVAILGVLRAGGAYVPMDPVYPRERLGWMLEDSGARVILTTAALAEGLPPGPQERLLLDGADLEREPATAAPARVDPENLAYVIYTSGSTGRPKGVGIPHANVTRLFEATEPWFGFGSDEVWTLFHSHSFDFSVWELWGALLYGGRLVVVPHWLSRAPDAFRRLLFRERVTVLSQTPSAFRQLLEVGEEAEDGEPALRWVVFGGEALDPAALQPWFERYGDRRPTLVNMYGITETTVHVTHRPLCRADARPGAGSVLGRSIPDQSLLLLDRSGEPVPVGVAGEICVGGDAGARGYLRRPALTAERFVPDPWSPRPGGRLYRSGDLARWRADGELEYLGRRDFQVKIRGFRIELGEIETALLRQPACARAVVLARPGAGGDPRLVAYLVAATGERLPEVASLRAALRQDLPEYMLPAAFVELSALPLTENGKLDRAALPEPDGAQGLERAEPVAARDELEGRLVEIWQQALGVEQVGVLDNFFDLGGHSLLMVQVLHRLREEVEEARRASVSIVDLFRFPTVSALAEHLRGQGEASPGALRAAEREGRLSSSLEQGRERMRQRLARRQAGERGEGGRR